jgi:hypothetical protein
MQNKKEVVVIRAWSDSRATLGMLTVKGQSHDPIFVLENPARETKDDSRIPAGTYECIPYSGTKYKGTYLIQNVPNRSAILFHNGNVEADTEGCLLVGNSAGMLNGEPAVMKSKEGFNALVTLIGQETFTLTIKDEG